MKLPDSIEAITEERHCAISPVKKDQATSNIDQLLFLIERELDIGLAKAFNKGRVFYKTASSEKAFIRNLLHLYIEIVSTNLRESDIEPIIGKAIISNFETICNVVIKVFDAQQDLLNTFNKDKKIIDVTEISCTIMGYAIETIRKIYNSKEQ